LLRLNGYVLLPPFPRLFSPGFIGNRQNGGLLGSGEELGDLGRHDLAGPLARYGSFNMQLLFISTRRSRMYCVAISDGKGQWTCQ
jgi:hypothetical protein